MKREIKTDNLFTEIVMEGQPFIHELWRELRQEHKTPFLHRELTKYDKAKRRAENVEW